jgi:hypothetical protein
LILAFLLAPLVAPPVTWLLCLIGMPAKDVFSTFVWIFFLYLPFAYGAEIVVGVVAWQLMKTYRITSAWVYAAGGALIALATVALLMAGVPHGLSSSPPFIVAGAISGLVFRFVALRREA